MSPVGGGLEGTGEAQPSQGPGVRSLDQRRLMFKDENSGPLRNGEGKEPSYVWRSKARPQLLGNEVAKPN